MDGTDSKQQVIERIQQASNILVTVSANPSVDSLSAALALTVMLNKISKRATAVFSGTLPAAIDFLEPGKTFENNVDGLRDFIIALDKNKADHLRYKVEDDVVRIFITPYRTTITPKDLQFSQGDFNIDLIVALGVDKRSDLDKAIVAHGRILHDATVVTVNASNQKSSLGSVDWQDPTASSLSEMLAGAADNLQPGLLDSQISTALLTGLVAATERFSNQRTSPKVMTLAAQLMAAGANQQLIATKLRPMADRSSDNRNNSNGQNQSGPIATSGPKNSSQQSRAEQPQPIPQDMGSSNRNNPSSQGGQNAKPPVSGSSDDKNNSSNNTRDQSKPTNKDTSGSATQENPKKDGIGELTVDHGPSKPKKSIKNSAYGPPRPQDALAAAEEALAEALPITPPAAQQTQDLRQQLNDETAAMTASTNAQQAASDLLADLNNSGDLLPEDSTQGNPSGSNSKPNSSNSPSSFDDSSAPAKIQPASPKPETREPLPPIITKSLPELPPQPDAQDSENSGPVPWQQRKVDRPIEPPQFGGTLNATSEQALEDNLKRDQEDRNQAILSHGRPNSPKNQPAAIPGAPKTPEARKDGPAAGSTLLDIEKSVKKEQPAAQPDSLIDSLISDSAPDTNASPMPSLPPLPPPPAPSSLETDAPTASLPPLPEPAPENQARQAVEAAFGGPTVAPSSGDVSQLSALATAPTDFEPLPGPSVTPGAPNDTPTSIDVLPPLPPAPTADQTLPQSSEPLPPPPIPELNPIMPPLSPAPGDNQLPPLPPMPDFTALPQPPNITDMPSPPAELIPAEQPPIPTIELPSNEEPKPPAEIPPNQFRIPGQ